MRLDPMQAQPCYYLGGAQFTSGCQLGSKSVISFLVRFMGRFLRPSGLAFITKISSSPPRSLWNAIFLPSGEKAGAKSKAAFLVTLFWEEPSRAFIAWMS